jgi:RNA polymerase primary sigma factor
LGNLEFKVDKQRKKDRLEQFFTMLFDPKSMKNRYLRQEPALQFYLDEIREEPLLTPNEEEALLRRASTGDQEARKQLLRSNQRLVVTIAIYFQNPKVPLMDLVQAGNMGLQEAIEKFDFSKARGGKRLSTYAKYYILRNCERLIATEGRGMPVPYWKAQLRDRIKEMVNRALAEGRELKVPEIARRMDMPEDQVQEMLMLMQEPLSIDLKRNDEQPSLLEFLRAPVASDMELLLEVREALQELPERERLVLYYRYGFHDGRVHTHLEIGHRFGVSRERIRQLEERAIQQLRAILLQERGR